MAKHRTLNGAIAANNLLAEAEIRYRLLAEAFEEFPKLRGNLNPALERAKAEIVRLRAMAASDRGSATTEAGKAGKVVAFDAGRFRRSAESGA